LDPKAAGERFIATCDGNSLSIKDFALVLKKNLSEGEGGKISTRSMPDFLLKIMGFLDKNAGSAVPELGKRHLGSNAKAKEVLGWKPKSAEDAIMASVKSLKEFGAV
jgi:dihydroflavonol-4-reductase